MRTLAVMVGLCALTWQQPQSGALPPAEIEAAIKLGLASKKKSHLDWSYTQDLPYLQCKAGGGLVAPQYYLTATGPIGRVALAAFEAKKKYMPFVASDVTAEMISATVIVEADVVFAGADVKHIVILTGKKGQQTAIQPLSTEPRPKKFTNSVGGNQEANGLKAAFDAAAFRSTNGPFAFAVIDGGGERRCDFPENNRGFLR
jgi:hypothetical protein